MKITILSLALLLTSLNSFAGKEGRFGKGDFLKKELNLTDEQVEKVKAIRKDGKDKMQANKKSFKELKTSFNESMKNPKSSNEELKNKFEAFQKARDEFQRERFTKMLEMRKILTPEQLIKFQEMRKHHKGKGRKGKKGSK